MCPAPWGHLARERTTVRSSTTALTDPTWSDSLLSVCTFRFPARTLRCSCTLFSRNFAFLALSSIDKRARSHAVEDPSPPRDKLTPPRISWYIIPIMAASLCHTLLAKAYREEWRAGDIGWSTACLIGWLVGWGVELYGEFGLGLGTEKFEKKVNICRCFECKGLCVWGKYPKFGGMVECWRSVKSKDVLGWKGEFEKWMNERTKKRTNERGNFSTMKKKSETNKKERKNTVINTERNNWKWFF